MAPLTVVVTRPGAAGQALVDELRQAGQGALWLPAFTFGPAPDEPAAWATVAALETFDLAIFVSPQAVRATAALLEQRWPAQTRIAVVGRGTGAAVREALDGAAEAVLIEPPEAGELETSGSEVLWPLLEVLQPPPRRVLLLRAQSGRDWLAERLRALGAVVVPLAVYSRNVTVPTASLREALAEAAATGLASVVSSSDAVAALAQMLGAQPEVWAALRAAPALAGHPRIAERLRAAGFAQVRVCALDEAAVRAALREGLPLESPGPASDAGDGGARS